MPGRDKRRNPDQAGSGIGLTIARSLARAHGGELTAASGGIGRGTTMTLALPAEPDPVLAEPGAGQVGAGPAR